MSSKKKKDGETTVEENLGEVVEKKAKKAKKITVEETLQQELTDKQNQLLSLAAEYDNFRKRSFKERETIYSDVKTNLLKEFLPVLDNLERALAGDESDIASYKKGVEMTFAGLVAVLEKAGVEAYGAVDEVFDPNLYNAVMHVEDDTVPEQTVVEVFQKGYKHGDRILREAMVKVAN